MKNKTTPTFRLGVFFAGLLTAISLQAGSFVLDFSSPGGSIVDSNGVASGFTARLSGTGGDITGNDTNLLLDTTTKVLRLHTSPGADFNGQANMSSASVVGINLSSLGYDGSEDFVATVLFTNLPPTGTNVNQNGQAIQPDQLCLVVGTDSATGVRAGFINFSAFHPPFADANEGFGTLMSGGSDAFDRFFGTVVGPTMTVVISRIGGTWSVTVNGIDRMPNSSIDGTGTPEPPTVVGLDAASDLFVGVVAMDVFNDSPWVANVKRFSVVVSGNAPPSINGDGQPTAQLVNEGNPVTYSVTPTDNTKAPIAYKWLLNGNQIPGGTNQVVTFNPLVTDAGGVTVVITNSLGSVTSSIAPLYVVIPKGKLNLNFAAAGGGLLDTNGVGTGFPTRLPGTGMDFPGSDPNLFLDTANHLLNITSTPGDYNGAGVGPTNESPGVSLTSLGLSGGEDVNASVIFPTLPPTMSFDQCGVYIGTDTNFITRAGWIDFTAFNSPRGKERYSENVSPNGGGVPVNNGGGQYFGFGFDTNVFPCTVLVTRVSGTWHAYIDGVQWDVLTQPLGLSGGNLTAGIFAYDTGADIFTQPVSNFVARVFDPPGMKVNQAGGNLTFTWNVAGAGLQSNTNLLNPASWTPVPNTIGTNTYVIPTPVTGAKFYRIGL